MRVVAFVREVSGEASLVSVVPGTTGTRGTCTSTVQRGRSGKISKVEVCPSSVSTTSHAHVMTCTLALYPLLFFFRTKRD
jgi:hypothetical protein